jgi:hypothetical protein
MHSWTWWSCIPHIGDVVMVRFWLNGVALADLDGVRQGALAAKMGERLYLCQGFIEVGVLKVEDAVEPPNRVGGDQSLTF